MTLAEARAIALAVAARELCFQQAARRRSDPRVALPLRDYKVEVYEHRGGAILDFLFEHANPDVPFMPWIGHPMHFSVAVARESGAFELVRGQ